MNCIVCIGRRSFARNLYPKRRPLFVRCWTCTQRRRVRIRLAKWATATVVLTPLVLLGMFWMVEHMPAVVWR